MRKVVGFISSVKSEMKKVSWPSRALATRATISVIIFSLSMGLWLWVMDVIFARLIHLLLTLG